MQKEAPFSIVLQSRHPEQLTIGIARSPKGVYNPIALGWITLTSMNPPMIAVSIGKSRYSVECFRHAREFVIAFPTADQMEQARLFGIRSGRDTDKLALAGLKTEKAHKIDCVLLSEAAANFECKLVTEFETGDHILFLGEVVCSHETDNPANRLSTLVHTYKMGPLRQD
jgi:flavin reductase (DIM6/NTAB) family NADH-FMN oxidoreductase RutF